MFLLRTLVLVWVQAYLLGPEMTKLPLLFLHYQEHLAENEALDFNSFLALHYTDTDHEGSDRSDHQNLPFHHHHGTAADQCVAKVWMSDPVPVVSFPELLGKRFIGGLTNDAELAGHARGLLQPPRSLV